MRIRILLLALALLAPNAALGQSAVFICVQTTGISNCAPVSATNPLPVTSSGGGGGAVTIADGADVAEGAVADAASAAGGVGTVSAKLRLMTTQLGTINTTLGSPFQAGGTIGNTTFASTVADGANVVEGATADAAATQGGTGTLSAKLRLLTTQFNTLNTTVATAANQTTMATNQTAVQGPVPAGAATATKFNLGGGEFRSTKPTVSDGQQIPFQTGTRGSLGVQIMDANGVSGAAVTAASSDAVSTASLVINGLNFGMLYDATQWVRARSIVGAVAAGTGTQAMHVAPTSAAPAAITPVVSTAAEGSNVLKSGAGNLYSLVATTGGTAGYVMVFNATSAPADGAVTPIECVVVAANSTVTINYGGVPSRYATGITAVFSSTGCFTKTVSATAFFSGKVQ